MEVIEGYKRNAQEMVDFINHYQGMDQSVFMMFAGDYWGMIWDDLETIRTNCAEYHIPILRDVIMMPGKYHDVIQFVSWLVEDLYSKNGAKIDGIWWEVKEGRTPDEVFTFYKSKPFSGRGKEMAVYIPKSLMIPRDEETKRRNAESMRQPRWIRNQSWRNSPF